MSEEGFENAAAVLTALAELYHREEIHTSGSRSLTHMQRTNKRQPGKCLTNGHVLC